MSYKPFTTNYTWQIINDIKEYLEETNKDQTTLDTLDLCHLIGEIERLNNIINNFEKLLSEEQATYEQYYQKGGTYVLPIEVFNELWGEMENWKDTCKQKENIIKEVRKYANSLTIFENIKEDLLAILNKEQSNENI